MSEINKAHQVVCPDSVKKIGGLWISSLRYVKDLVQNQFTTDFCLNQPKFNAICSVTLNQQFKLPTYCNFHVNISLEDHQDVQTQQFMTACQNAYAFIQSCISSGNNVLVHCVLGISRSPAICAYYLMRAQNIPFEQANQKIKNVRKHTKINAGFSAILKKLAFKKSEQMSLKLIPRL